MLIFYSLLFLAELVILYFLSHKLIALIFLRLLGLLRNRNWAIYTTAVLFLPGTFIHEIAHFLTALFLLVPVRQMELLPEVIEKDGDAVRVKMGSVPMARTDFIRRFLIGTAPFIFGTALMFYLINSLWLNHLIGNYWLAAVITVLAVFEIGNTMFSSREDLAEAWVLLFVILVIWAGLYFLGVRISVVSDGFIMKNILPAVRQADIFLLVPLVVDFVFLLMLRNVKDRTGKIII